RSDPHVSDLPRVMRLPGFPHQKDGSAGELVRVLGLHDGDSYSNTDFQTALAQALASSIRPNRGVAETALANLGPAPPDWNQGYSEGSRNSECARRAGSCLAQGMNEKETLEKCLEWNKENNRPPLNDEEVAATVASIARAHARNHAAAADDLPRGEKDERKRTTWTTLKTDWVYVTAQEVFIRRHAPKVVMYSVKGFGNMFAYLKRELEVTQSLTNYIFSRPPSHGLDMFESFCYMPGQPENYDGDLNLWRPSPIVSKRGDASWFTDHLLWLFGGDSEHVLNWCAWVYRFPHLHPKHALLTHGEIQGTGKSVIANVMKRLFGPWNCTILDQGALDLEHDAWKVRTKLLLIEEVRPGFGSSNALAKKLHPLISEDTVHVDMKNRNDFDMPNVIAGLFGSNRPDALTMDDSDRRYLIVSTDRDGKILKPRERDYYRTLYGKDGFGGKLNDLDALAAVAWELRHRDLKGYSAQDPAPRTAAKARMIEAAGSELQKWMLDSDAVRAHKLVAVDRIVHQVPPDIDRRHRGNLRTDIADVLRRKFSGVPVKNQIRPHGKDGGKLRVWALGEDAETTAALSGDKLAKIWKEEYEPRATDRQPDDVDDDA
ncbi:MAG: primase C-terminal domain-containing protein, partial [Hyphomicrobiales bacterium]|nr:primase C-terminal domain-containing protein [Hyphomicrobiales bacterium]